MSSQTGDARRVYWSVPVLGRLNLASVVPAIKICELLDAGNHVTILLGDLHSQLLGDKSSALKSKIQYYRTALKTLIESIGSNTSNLDIVDGTSIQLKADFMLDFYLVCGSTPIDVALEAGKEAVKASKHPTVGGFVYPIVRAVDEKYIKADFQLASDVETRVVKFTDDIASKIQHKPAQKIIYQTLTGLSAGKVTVVCEDDDQIDLFDGPKQVKKKLSKAFCEPGNILESGVLPILKHIIYPIFKKLDVYRPTEYGGDVEYLNYESVEKDFAEQKLHPGDLKKSIENQVNKLLEKMQDLSQTSKEFQDSLNLAFPIKKDKKPPPVVPIHNSLNIDRLSLNTSAVGDAPLSNNDRMTLITRRLQEVLQQETLEKIISERAPRIYWGTATTGRPHLAYFVPIAKISDFLSAGCEVTILLADLHGYLDSQKAPWDLLDARTRYYQQVIVSMLKSIGVNIDKLKFVRGTEFELNSDFSNDVIRLASQTTLHDAKKAGAEVVKQMSDPLIGSLLYPLLQALDEEYLDCDAQFGGVDQRKIFTYAEKYLPQIGYKKRIHLMNPMVPGLSGGKMSSSEIESKIDLLDDTATVYKKVQGALCDPNNIAENGVFAFIENVILPLSGEITVEVTDITEPRSYESIGKVVSEFLAGVITETSLKKATADYINKMLKPIRADFENEELKALTLRAYPIA